MMKKYIIALLAVLVSMLMISTATAVNNYVKSSEPTVNIEVNEEETDMLHIFQKVNLYVDEQPESTGLLLALDLMFWTFTVLCLPVNAALIALLGPIGLVISVVFDVFALSLAFIGGFLPPIPMP